MKQMMIYTLYNVMQQIMMYASCMLRELWVFKIIIIYTIFIEFIDKKIKENVIEQMMMCTPCISNYYLCDFFKEIIDNKKN
jgi:hypothetical protein